MKINGNLDFYALGSELRNAIIERLASDPATTETGRMYYNTDDNEYRYFNGTNWLPFGEGQLAEKLEASMGGITNVDGTYNAGDVNTALGNVDGNSTTLLEALSQLDAVITANKTATETNAAAITAAGTAAVTYDDTSKKFSNGADEIGSITLTTTIYGLSNTSSITGNGFKAGELTLGSNGIHFEGSSSLVHGYQNATDGIEFRSSTGTLYILPAHLDGYITNSRNESLMPKKYITDSIAAVTASLTATKLDDLSDVDAHTNNVARSTLAVNAAADGFELIAARTITSSLPNGLVIADGNGVAGDPTITLDTGLESIAGLSTDADKMIYTTDSDTYAVTDLSAFGRTLLGNADNTAMRTTLGLGSIATKSADDYLAKAGGTMSGPINMGTQLITSLADPVNAGDAAHKGYVDGAVAGLSWKNPAIVATTTDPVTHVNENVDLANPPASIDGHTLVDSSANALIANERYLIKDQTEAKDNGIYELVGGALTRVTDMDATSPINEVNGAALLVLSGTNANRSFTVTSTVTTIGDAITFAPFAGASAINAGVGLQYAGNTMSVHLGAGIKELPTDGVGIELHDTNNGALILTDDGNTRGDYSDDDKLHLLLNAAGGLEQNAAGLAVKVGGVTTAMLDKDTFTFGSDTSNVAAKLGTVVHIKGGNAMSVTGSSNILLVDADVATDTQQGVASFATEDFTVTNGVVTMNPLDAGSVTNAMLADSSYVVSGDNASVMTLNLGENYAIISGAGIETFADNGTSKLTISATIATAGDLGSVKVGAGLDIDSVTGVLSLNASSAATTLSALTDTDVAANDTAGSMMVANGTDKYEHKLIQFIGDYTAANTSHTVAHSLGQKFVNVTVYNEAGEQILPKSVTLTDENALVVTFNSAIKCTVVVMGTPGLAKTTV